MGTAASPRTVAVWGADRPLGRRLVARLAADPGVLTRVVAPDPPELADLSGVAALVVLGPPLGPDVDGTGGSGLDGPGLAAVLAAAGEAGVGTVVALSSALVYGAWPGGPVPLTEQAPVRPPEGVGPAWARAEVERVVGAWRQAHPGATAALLRPVVAVDPTDGAWFRRSPWGALRRRAVEGAPPLQLVALDDLVAALDLAWRRGLDGPVNVAPDGWLDAADLDELLGPAPVLAAVPRRLRRGLDRLRRPGPDGADGLDAYLARPWVVANDRLRAAGWAPSATTEELVVAVARQGRWLPSSPRARQELSLVAAAGVVAAAVVGGAVSLRRRSARRG